ncbi:MAG: hypothetical protein DRO08_04740 [Thermoprotei archaeon]|nr:MAG: hypothetical protein B6U76_11310 [Desulfurococcales archaeon ex4484_217_2]RLG71429.1 MAG: hypothetical protein DRO08_04740 [Thermoprotei archaeon]
MSKKASKYSGFILLAIGLVLLVTVFIFAYVEYKSVTVPEIGSTENIISWMLSWGIYLVMKIAFLGIMGWVGSIITLRGVSLLTASEERY